MNISRSTVGVALGLGALALAGLAPSAARASGPNLVTNPGFETGDFTGYTQSGNLGFTSVVSDPYYVHSGTFGARLGPFGSDGFLTQDLVTVPGQTYDISFFLKSDNGTPNDIHVSFGGSQVFSETNLTTNNVFEQFRTTGMANSASTPLVLGFRKDPSYFGLDDLSVTVHSSSPVPEASTAISFGLLLVLGLGSLTFSARRRKAQAAE